MLIEETGTGVRVRSGDDAVELTTDEALALFGRLSGLLSGLPAPELYRPEHADGEGWACPHCRESIVSDGDLIEYDSHQAESPCEFDGDGLHVSQADTERETMAWLCGQCRRVVTVPGEISVDWS